MEREIKCTQTGKEEVKKISVSICTENKNVSILYREKIPKNSRKAKISKVAGYKFHSHTHTHTHSVVFVYATSSQQSKKKSRKEFHL